MNSLIKVSMIMGVLFWVDLAHSSQSPIPDNPVLEGMRIIASNTKQDEFFIKDDYARPKEQQAIFIKDQYIQLETKQPRQKVVQTALSGIENFIPRVRKALQQTKKITRRLVAKKSNYRRYTVPHQFRATKKQHKIIFRIIKYTQVLHQQQRKRHLKQISSCSKPNKDKQFTFKKFIIKPYVA